MDLDTISPELLLQTAIYLKPCLLLKGREIEVYKLLKGNEKGLTALEVKNILEVSTNHAHQVLKRLHDKKLVTKDTLGTVNGFLHAAVKPKFEAQTAELLYYTAIHSNPKLVLKGREIEVYKLLKDNEKGLTALEVKNTLEVSTNHAHQVLKRLYDKKLVTKKPLEKTRGFIFIVITPELALEFNLT